MTETEKTLIKVLNDLLNVEELNGENLDDSTVAAIYEAHKAIRSLAIPFNVQDFMCHLKPFNPRRFMDECWVYYYEAREAYIDGESSYEVRGYHTKNRNPWVVFNQ